MEKLYKTINHFLEILLVFLFVVLVADVLWQVFSRYSVGKSQAFTEELARYLLVWLAILGTAYVRSYKGEMAIDYFFNKLSDTKKRVMNFLIEITILLFALIIMVVGGSNLMYITLKLGQVSATLNIPIGYIYSVVPLSGLIIIFYCVYHLRSLYKEGKQENLKSF
ncbi:TRAP transporter small permease [Capnocytophaga felis]|nr:TRAP transporter small permease [Capnocytophaga felis]